MYFKVFRGNLQSQEIENIRRKYDEQKKEAPKRGRGRPRKPDSEKTPNKGSYFHCITNI